jgi:hypothetical protein
MALIADKFYWIHDNPTGWTWGRSIIFCGVLHDLTGLRLHREHSVSVVHYFTDPRPESTGPEFAAIDLDLARDS